MLLIYNILLLRGTPESRLSWASDIMTFYLVFLLVCWWEMTLNQPSLQVTSNQLLAANLLDNLLLDIVTTPRHILGCSSGPTLQIG